MADFNRVILLGRVTRDIELKYTAGNTAVTDIGMAITDKRKSQSGEWIEETTFVDVTLWGRTAEVASEYLSKGAHVLIEGRLKLDTWETDGQKRSKLRVVAERMQLMPKSGGGGGGGSGGGSRSGSRAGQRDESEYSYADHGGDAEPPRADSGGGGAGGGEEIPF